MGLVHDFIDFIFLPILSSPFFLQIDRALLHRFNLSSKLKIQTICLKAGASFVQDFQGVVLDSHKRW